MILVYQAYGREDVLHQTLFSVTSLLSVIKSSSPLEIWIYTDNQTFFENFFSESLSGSHSRVRLVGITAAQIQKWRGAIDFVHRVKVEILHDAGQKFDGSLFYVDGDTYFHEDPTELFSCVTDEKSLMHVAEGAIDQNRDLLSKKIKKFLKKNKFSVSGEEVSVAPSTVMWNAGAIGISQKNKNLLPSILELTDRTYAVYAKHIMEQLAFSYYLQKHTQVFAADSVIGHYWNQKNEYQKMIDVFFSENPTWVKAKEKYPTFSWPAPAAAWPAQSLWPEWLRF